MAPEIEALVTRTRDAALEEAAQIVETFYERFSTMDARRGMYKLHGESPAAEIRSRIGSGSQPQGEAAQDGSMVPPEDVQHQAQPIYQVAYGAKSGETPTWFDVSKPVFDLMVSQPGMRGRVFAATATKETVERWVAEHMELVEQYGNGAAMNGHNQLINHLLRIKRHARGVFGDMIPTQEKGEAKLDTVAPAVTSRG